MTATINPFRAPTSCETSTLEATHVTCDSCDRHGPWVGTLDASEWRCSHCGEDPGVGPRPVWEHHSPVPLGFRDDKACYWPGYAIDGVLVPESWIYKAKAPAA